ncbi:hypothetical protein [Marinoscillum pacificum]|uniref:hypothetical protein n=1 Tax=Marinoscillum pacificum TaxID=392723 RepID=UPI002157AE88|nr:hypothetical protein [Marinoscillum pacificum]
MAGNNNNANFYRASSTLQQPKIKLALAGDQFESETLVAFDLLATNDIDYALDAKRKLANTAVSLYSINNGVELAIQALGLSSLDDITIPLGYTVKESGDYLIKTKQLEGINEDLSVWLVDLESNTSYNLQENVDISVHLDKKASDKRFALKVLSSRVLAETNMASDLTLLKANERGLTIRYAKKDQYITVYDVNGRVHFNKTIYGEEQPVSVDVKLNRHQVYILKVGNESLKFSIK